MLERVIFAGFGGQGVLTIGKTVAGLGLKHFPHVTYFPSYGIEVRGGTANCQVILSTEEIASPVVERADNMILMNQPSLERFLPRLKGRGGRAFVNSSLARAPEDRRVVNLPATDMAAELGDVRSANIIMLGAYLSGQKWAAKETFKKHLAQKLKRKGENVVELNLRAFELGWGYKRT
ncbi:MAG TPA: 2-oxoacid:acceptor oxidoreductase family protein [archaeon]|nr:2-oxoacid:acceptor oxidoreductase family protein [archaeon]